MLEVLRYMFNCLLCTLGAIAYLALFGWTVVGVWVLSFAALKTIVMMMASGYPVPNMNLAFGLLMSGLAAHFSLTSPMIAGLFRRVPVLRPTLIVGCIFLLGSAVTHAAVFHILNAGAGRTLALIAGTAGIALTRVFMSWLFEKVPVEMLAPR